MPGFFKMFLAALLAMFVFVLLCFVFVAALAGSLVSKEVPVVPANSVLTIDLAEHFREQKKEEPLAAFSENITDIPGLYDMVRLIGQAKADNKIRGIYLLAGRNANGFASSEELRTAFEDFKRSGKFIYAYGDQISQQAYSVANVADKIFLHPQGSLEWDGLHVEYLFLKGSLEKLEVKPQIFYAGKFKSATEPFRVDKMTPENALQTSVWLNDLYDDLLSKTAQSRKIDTAMLRKLAADAAIQTPEDALQHKLVDVVGYDDQVKDAIRKELKSASDDKINFVSLKNYMRGKKNTTATGDKIALIYAEGNIVDGKGDYNNIGGDRFRNLIQKARLDKTIKAIVFRVNSGGGSALASESIWRELALAKKVKPVVVSFGDVAASGGYYISCAADSIFAWPSSITGSIGVFGIIPNMESFFKNKLGVTFDGVSTAPYADAGAIYRPLKAQEETLVQNSIDRIYTVFKQRVADGRKKDTNYIDSIAQGRVWTGKRALQLGLVDKMGGLGDAVKCAVRLAKLDKYRIKEYPEPENYFDRLLGKAPGNYDAAIRNELGEKNYKLLHELKQVNEMSNIIQARMPFRFYIY